MQSILLGSGLIRFENEMRRSPFKIRYMIYCGAGWPDLTRYHRPGEEWKRKKRRNEICGKGNGRTSRKTFRNFDSSTTGLHGVVKARIRDPQRGNIGPKYNKSSNTWAIGPTVEFTIEEKSYFVMLYWLRRSLLP